MLFSFAVFLSATGCEGPEGPSGPRGAQGLPGNANVHSSLYTVASSDWSGNGGIYSVTLINGDITEEIMESGTVLVYLLTTSGGWENFPYVFTEGGYDAQFYARHHSGSVRVFKSGGAGARPAGSIIIKVVVAASLADVREISTPRK